MNLRQLVCAVRGHDDLLHVENGRMCLQCMSCGFESTGWTLVPETKKEPTKVSREGVLTLVRGAGNYRVTRMESHS